MDAIECVHFLKIWHVCLSVISDSLTSRCICFFLNLYNRLILMVTSLIKPFQPHSLRMAAEPPPSCLISFPVFLFLLCVVTPHTTARITFYWIHNSDLVPFPLKIFSGLLTRYMLTRDIGLLISAPILSSSFFQVYFHAHWIPAWGFQLFSWKVTLVWEVLGEKTLCD
jgi:hypothetical protein